MWSRSSNLLLEECIRIRLVTVHALWLLRWPRHNISKNGERSDCRWWRMYSVLIIFVVVAGKIVLRQCPRESQRWGQDCEKDWKRKLNLERGNMSLIKLECSLILDYQVCQHSCYLARFLDSRSFSFSLHFSNLNCSRGSTNIKI